MFFISLCSQDHVWKDKALHNSPKYQVLVQSWANAAKTSKRNSEQMGQTNPEVIRLFLNDISGFSLAHSISLNVIFFQMKNFIEFDSLVMAWCFQFFCVRILFPCEIFEMLSTSQGHRLIMKRAFNLATQLLVGLMKIITCRGRCCVLCVTDYECLAFGNFPHSQIAFSSKVTHSSPIAN